MLAKYLDAAVEKAEYKQLEDHSWFAEIPGFSGVWANAKNIEACRRDLIEVPEEWILLKTRDHEKIPVIDNIDINAKSVTA